VPTLVAGVLAIGLVNLVVSFALALKVALRSRGIGPEQTQGLLPAILRRFVERPADFFRAPRATPAEAAAPGAAADASPAGAGGRGVSPPSSRA
jgi:site-specific recombinase